MKGKVLVTKESACDRSGSGRDNNGHLPDSTASKGNYNFDGFIPWRCPGSEGEVATVSSSHAAKRPRRRRQLSRDHIAEGIDS
jgi:hypothetical protein